MQNLFVYGTLMLPEVSEKIFGRTSAEAAILSNFKRFKICYKRKELFYPAIIEMQHAQTKGILFCDISALELQIIDNYEGDEYERRIVEVKYEDEFTQAWCYVWKQNNDYQLKGEWTIEWFRKYFLSDFISNKI